jgi:hypothetical protein
MDQSLKELILTLSQECPEHHILISLCEGLTIPNPNSGGNLPGAAESWTGK